ncbi:TadE/TadG family type IV pilus assembly protein [Kitasatospora sp. NPDC054939]
MAIEAAIVAPAVVALVLVAVAAGRLQTAAGTVEAAARSAARTASLARSVDGMEDAARASAAVTLNQQGVNCRDLHVDLAHGELDTPVGPLATVTVRITCGVGLSDLLFGPGMPVTRTLVGEFTSVLDRYRGT